MPDTFQDLVRRLTRPHTRQVQRDAGTTVVEADGLLTQLRAAVFGGMEGGGSGSAFGSKPPIDVSAADLLDEIDRQAAEALATVSHTVTPFGTTESYVALWAAATSEQKLITVTVRRERELTMAEERRRPVPPRVYFERQQMSSWRLLESWVARVEDFFNPPSTREIRAKCPACDARHVGRVQDGSMVRSAALNFVRDRDGNTIEAKCSACKVSWAPSQFEWLAKNVGAKPLPELREA